MKECGTDWFVNVSGAGECRKRWQPEIKSWYFFPFTLWPCGLPRCPFAKWNRGEKSVYVSRCALWLLLPTVILYEENKFLPDTTPSHQDKTPGFCWLEGYSVSKAEPICPTLTDLAAELEQDNIICGPFTCEMWESGGGLAKPWYC